MIFNNFFYKFTIIYFLIVYIKFEFYLLFEIQIYNDLMIIIMMINFYKYLINNKYNYIVKNELNKIYVQHITNIWELKNMFKNMIKKNKKLKFWYYKN